MIAGETCPDCERTTITTWDGSTQTIWGRLCPVHCPHDHVVFPHRNGIGYCQMCDTKVVDLFAEQRALGADLRLVDPRAPAGKNDHWEQYADGRDRIREALEQSDVHVIGEDVTVEYVNLPDDTGAAFDEFRRRLTEGDTEDTVVTDSRRPDDPRDEP